MGSKAIESRRTSGIELVGRQTSIDINTPDIEVWYIIDLYINCGINGQFLFMNN